MSTAEAAVATLIAHGVDTVYALPGIHNDHLFDAFQRTSENLRVVHTRHEQGAAYMALGAALATGKPQTYAVVPGPGLLNSGAALLTAYGMNAPVLAIIGQIRRRQSVRVTVTCTRSAIKLESCPASLIIRLSFGIRASHP
jgi:acetolactate synthase-1/2/3 large subunit